MYPTLSLEGDYVLHSKLLLLSTNSPPPLNSLVTAISPLDPSHQVLKRIKGLPGDLICIDPSGERTRDETGRGKIMNYLKIPEGHVWLAGDNFSNSIDSRDYGPVPIGLIKGLVVARVSPFLLLLFFRAIIMLLFLFSICCCCFVFFSIYFENLFIRFTLVLTSSTSQINRYGQIQSG